MSRKTIALLFILFPVFALAQVRETECPFCGTASPKLKVMSFNIRNGRADVGENAWDNRKLSLAECINIQDADVAGLQEVHDFQLKDILKLCPEYSGIGKGRDDGEKGEQTSILWKPSTLELLEWGCFWLSETPSVPSCGWDAKYPRIATWAFFRHKSSGNVFLFMNTHLDHRGQLAKKEGLNLMLSEIAKINVLRYPVVLTGDFNIPDVSKSIDTLSELMTDARECSPEENPVKSFNAWGDSSRAADIDYIFFSGFKSCIYFKTIDSSYLGRKYISDHYPVCACLSIQE